MILVTGGTGELGGEIVRQLAGRQVAVMSRRAGEGLRAAQLGSGEGLAAAVAGVETIIHAAFSPTGDPRVDVEGTQRLLREAKDAGVRHFIYVSIVGIDRVPNAYYRAKLAAEAAVEAGGVAWTIQRVTQFHSFVDKLLRKLVRLPIAVLPTALKFQSIETTVAAERFVELAGRGAAGRAVDLGGPQVQTLGQMARLWMAARGKRRPVFSLPAFGKAQAAIARGALTCPEHGSGGTFEQWLAGRYSA